MITPVLHVSASNNPLRCLPVSMETKTNLYAAMSWVSYGVLDMKRGRYDDIIGKLKEMAVLASTRSVVPRPGPPACTAPGREQSVLPRPGAPVCTAPGPTQEAPDSSALSPPAALPVADAVVAPPYPSFSGSFPQAAAAGGAGFTFRLTEARRPDNLVSGAPERTASAAGPADSVPDISAADAPRQSVSLKRSADQDTGSQKESKIPRQSSE